MPLQEGNGPNNFVRAEVVRVDSRDAEVVAKNTYMFRLPNTIHHVVGLEIQDFFLPDIFFSHMLTKNKIDIRLQNDFINGGLPKIITAEVGLLPIEYSSVFYPRADLFVSLYKALNTAVGKDPDFGDKVEIVPLLDNGRKLGFHCRTWPFLSSGIGTTKRIDNTDNLQTLYDLFTHSSNLYADVKLFRDVVETNENLFFRFSRNVNEVRIVSQPAIINEPPINSTSCSFLFGSGPNAANSAASIIGFPNIDVTFRDYSKEGFILPQIPVKASPRLNRNLTGFFGADGISIVTGDRILLQKQTNKVANGVYDVQAGGVLVRSADFSLGANISQFAVFVEDGETYKGEYFVCVNDPGSDVVGTNQLFFEEIVPAKVLSADFFPDIDRNRFLDIFVKEISETEALSRVFFPRANTTSLTSQEELTQVRLISNPIRDMRVLTVVLKTEEDAELSSSTPFFFNFRVYSLESSVDPALSAVQNRINLLG
jgi:hypothetical protein